MNYKCPKCGSFNCWREKSPTGNTGCHDCGHVLDYTKSQDFDNHNDEKADSDDLTCRICGKPVKAIERITFEKKRQTIFQYTHTHFTCSNDECRAVLILPGEEAEAVKKYRKGAKP